MPGTEEIEPLEDLDLAAGEYARACADADGEARRRLRDEFVGQALPFARRLAGRYRGRGEPPEDLEQVARLGLVKSVDRFDPARGSFTAYAVVTITGEIKRYFRDHTWGLHVPRGLQDLALESLRGRTLLTNLLSRVPTTAELAEYLGVTGEELRRAQNSALAYNPDSLNAPLGDAEDGAEVGDLLGTADPALGLVDDRTTVEGLLCHLPPRERRLLALRFYGNLSQVQIADELGISQMHVSRLLSQALTWLRHAMLTDTPPHWPGVDDVDHRLAVAVHVEPRAITARVTGEIDRDNADHLRRELLGAVAMAQRAGRVVIDLAGVPLLDAAGVGVLVAVREAARVRGVTVRVAGLQPWVARVVAIAGLRDLLIDE